MNSKSNIIPNNYTIHEALLRIDKMAVSGNVLFIVNPETNVLIGTLTDGDIRRGLLQGLNVNDCVVEVCNKHFKFLKYAEQWTKGKLIEEFKAAGIRLIPLLDDNMTLIKIIDLNEFKAFLPMDAVIMAGGKGTRLRPLTKNTPKPLLKVGEKPIIEHNVDRLQSFGIKNITISVKYLGQQIIDFFGDGTSKELNIDYVKETNPLGTIGCLSLIPAFSNEYILVMNSDLLTTIDYNDMFKEFLSSNADMIVATTPYEVQIPYGVVETSGENVTSLVEKPTYTYYSNAGIYILKKQHVKLIPNDKLFNATDLMQSLFDLGKKVVHFPIVDYWLDIGKPHDYEKAQKDIKHLNL